MKTKLLFLTMAVLLLISCKTTHRTTHVETSESETVELIVSEEMKETTQVNSHNVMQIKRELFVESDEAITHTVWSAPDSAGNQHPVETTQINRNTREREYEDRNAEIQQHYQAEMTKIREEQLRLQAEKTTLLEEIAITELSNPLREKIGFWLTLLPILIIVFFLIKWYFKLKRTKR
jgi:cation transport ATPase